MSGAERIVVISGASGGIGLAAARAFLAHGDRVYGLSRTPGPEVRVRHVPTDVTDDAQVCAAINTIAAEAGRIDVLVCNAGMGVSGAVEFQRMEDAEKQLNVCFFGATRCVRAALPYLRRSCGHALFVSSVAGSIPIPFQTYYSCAKAAVNALVMALRGELRHTGVRVAAVLPGDIRTGFTAAREKCTDGADVYPAMIRSVAGMERDEQKGMDPSAIGNKLLKLSLQKHPKPLSTVGLQYKVFLVLAKLLPARTLSWLVGLLYAN
jgi:Short-chain dehydrogenases of various substrate specificities